MLQAKEGKNNIENQIPDLPQAMHDDSPHSSKQEKPISQTKQAQEPSMDIIIRPPIVINLDDDNEIAKFMRKCIKSKIYFFPLP